MDKPTYKELEEKVKNLNEKLKELEFKEIWITYSQSPIPTLVLSESGKHLEYNDAMAKLTGYRYDEIPDIETWMTKLYPDKKYRKKVIEIAKKSMHKEIDIKRNEFIITRKDGEQRYVALSVYNIIHEMKPTNLQIVQGEDITDLKKVEEELIKNENKFRELAESIHDVFLAMDRNFNCTYWNEASERLTGISAEEALGKSIYDIFPDIKDTKVEKLFIDILEKQKPDYIEHYYQVENTIYIFEINAYPTRDGLSVFMKDITVRKHMEENLRLSELKLRKQMDALEQKNIALREVIEQVEIEKNIIKDDIITNIQELIIPVLEKLKLSNNSDEYIDLLSHLLDKLSSSFGRKITKKTYKLTPREIEISTMIESGLMNKEISVLLNVSCNTIEKHRENIRKKLGIFKKDINLRTHLRRIQSYY